MAGAVSMDADALRLPDDNTVSHPKEVGMPFGYTIISVPDVAASLACFTRAFGLARRFLHESGTYGELETGATTLAFAAHELGETHFPGGHVAAHSAAQPLGMEIALVTAVMPSTRSCRAMCANEDVAIVLGRSCSA
jgi:lactoylglutathione lyase